MSLYEFARTVQQMREAQARYFANRSQTNLVLARTWEKKVDNAVRDALAGPSLYGPTLHRPQDMPPG